MEIVAVSLVIAGATVVVFQTAWSVTSIYQAWARNRLLQEQLQRLRLERDIERVLLGDE